MLKLTAHQIFMTKSIVNTWSVVWLDKFLDQYEKEFTSYAELMKDFKAWLVKQDF